MLGSHFPMSLTCIFFVIFAPQHDEEEAEDYGEEGTAEFQYRKSYT